NFKASDTDLVIASVPKSGTILLKALAFAIVNRFRYPCSSVSKDYHHHPLLTVSRKRANVEPNEISCCILATAHAVARLYAVCEAYVEAIEKSKTGNNWSTLDVLLKEFWVL
ncbi:hypothetical protein MKX01_020376, partial [Papaver californicum]